MTPVELGKLTRTKTNKKWQSRLRSISVKAGPAEQVPGNQWKVIVARNYLAVLLPNNMV